MTSAAPVKPVAFFTASTSPGLLDMLLADAACEPFHSFGEGLGFVAHSHASKMTGTLLPQF